MKNAIKAALLSAFVFPGAGHFYLKKAAVGNLILVPAVTAIGYLSWQAYQKALLISQKIVNGEIPLQLNALYHAITQAPVGSEALLINISTSVFILSWLASIVDAYRLGNKLDNSDVLR